MNEIVREAEFAAELSQITTAAIQYRGYLNSSYFKK
jgi:hypothetical protein